MAAPKKVTSSDLISHAKSSGFHLPDPSAEAMRELKAVIAYNDGAIHGKRVTAPTVIEMLRGYGWAGEARGALDAVCKRKLGRRSFGYAK